MPLVFEAAGAVVKSGLSLKPNHYSMPKSVKRSVCTRMASNFVVVVVKDDFEIAMRMYTLADKAIAPEEFSRAVAICTGRQLSPHVVLTVFQVSVKLQMKS